MTTRGGWKNDTLRTYYLLNVLLLEGSIANAFSIHQKTSVKKLGLNKLRSSDHRRYYLGHNHPSSSSALAFSSSREDVSSRLGYCYTNAHIPLFMKAGNHWSNGGNMRKTVFQRTGQDNSQTNSQTNPGSDYNNYDSGYGSGYSSSGAYGDGYGSYGGGYGSYGDSYGGYGDGGYGMQYGPVTRGDYDRGIMYGGYDDDYGRYGGDGFFGGDRGFGGGPGSWFGNIFGGDRGYDGGRMYDEGRYGMNEYYGGYDGGYGVNGGYGDNYGYGENRMVQGGRGIGSWFDYGMGGYGDDYRRGGGYNPRRRQSPKRIALTFVSCYIINDIIGTIPMFVYLLISNAVNSKSYYDRLRYGGRISTKKIATKLFIGNVISCTYAAWGWFLASQQSYMPPLARGRWKTFTVLYWIFFWFTNKIRRSKIARFRIADRLEDRMSWKSAQKSSKLITSFLAGSAMLSGVFLAGALTGVPIWGSRTAGIWPQVVSFVATLFLFR